MDKYLNHPLAAEHVTYINEKMQFHDSEAEDPDWMVRQCYTLIIAGASEMENGVENLWKKGAASGRRNHPDFDQYIDKNVFKAFKYAAHFCFAEEEHWYKEPRELTWDISLPCMNKFNER
jgi:hypothetical protein